MRLLTRPATSSRLRVLLVLFAAALVPACGSDTDAAPEAPESLAARTLETPTTTTSSTTTTSTTTTTTTIVAPLPAFGEPRLLRTTTDVIAPILASDANGWLVRSPCRELVYVTDGEPLDRVHVVIDPGHGGTETGAVAPDGLAEKDVNLDVAELVIDKLENRGVDALMTRSTDIRMPLLTRAEIADHVEARLLVSIHHQGTEPFPESDIPGTEIYYQQGSVSSKRFAGLLREEALEELGRFDITWFAGQDAGAVYRPHADTGIDFYGMIRIPETPAVLAEMAFLGNPAEVELLRSPEFIDAEAEAIADAVERFFATDDPGSGFVEPSYGLRSAGGGGGLGGCDDPDLGPVDETPPVLLERVGEAAESG